MNSEVEENIRKNVSWAKLPGSIQQQLGNSQKEYEKCVVQFSIKNQLRHRGNLVRQYRKDEKKYYTDLITDSRRSLMLFPYHLSDVVIKGLTITPFAYYVSMLEMLMAQEKSYDSLPNFTAADCLRLLGIGRNQYIDLMNQSRSTGKKFTAFFRGKSGRDLLPSKPVANITILPWWIVQVGYITEEDIKGADKAEHALIDQLIDKGSCPAGHLDYQVVYELYRKGLLYFDIPISEDDHVMMPPLEGFVMNRVLGDYFETLLYKIFVSIDENTTVKELATVLEIDENLVKDAVSLYCRLGFAKKKNCDLDSNDLHPSWYDMVHGQGHTVHRPRTLSVSSDEDDSLLRELNQALEIDEGGNGDSQSEMNKSKLEDDQQSEENVVQNVGRKRIAFLYDSTLTAYLMMGNLSPGLKNHAVTMFEVGKLSDESLESLVTELEKVSNVDGEGEAERYFSHALTLRDTILFLRQNPSMKTEDSLDQMCFGLDLIRCESLTSLDANTACRLLKKNYNLLVSMAPLSAELRPALAGSLPPHLGPPIPEVASLWFKMFLYHTSKRGPVSLLLAKGTRLRRLPNVLEKCHRLLVTSWGHDPSEIPVTGALTMILDALQHSPILVQAVGLPGQNAAKTKDIPFPYKQEDEASKLWQGLPELKFLYSDLEMSHTCGYVTLLNFDMSQIGKTNVELVEENESDVEVETESGKMVLDLGEKTSVKENWILLDCNFGLPLFDAGLNKKICDSIVSSGLWKKNSLESLQKSNDLLCSKLLAFIDQFQDLGDKNHAKVKKDQGQDNIPWPTRNLYFDGETLVNWDGR